MALLKKIQPAQPDPEASNRNPPDAKSSDLRQNLVRMLGGGPVPPRFPQPQGLSGKSTAPNTIISGVANGTLT